MEELDGVPYGYQPWFWFPIDASWCIVVMRKIEEPINDESGTLLFISRFEQVGEELRVSPTDRLFVGGVEKRWGESEHIDAFTTLSTGLGKAFTHWAHTCFDRTQVACRFE